MRAQTIEHIHTLRPPPTNLQDRNKICLRFIQETPIHPLQVRTSKPWQAAIESEVTKPYFEGFYFVESGSSKRSGWRTTGQLSLSVEDRFRFMTVICFIGLGLLGTGGLFYLNDIQSKRFSGEAADLAVKRWSESTAGHFGQWFVPTPSETADENAPAILEANRLIPKASLSESLIHGDITVATQTNGEHVWVISRHALLEPNTALILAEKDYPELKIAREAFNFQRWLVTTLLLVLLGACTAFFIFNKHFIFKPLNLLRDALLTRRLTDAARVKQSQKSKITIERLEQKSRFPLEQFENDEFGQIALILEDQDLRQKSLRDNWLKSFNTINEPIAIFSQNAKLKHVNEAMEQFLDEIGLTTELVSHLPAQTFINSYLQLEEEIANKIGKVINQKHPKIQSVSCSVEMPEGRRSFRYSISTIINHGERFGIFCLVREQSLTQGQPLEDVILEQANGQLKTIHRIQQYFREQNQSKNEALLHLCDSLIDNIHSLLEISNASNPSYATHKIEFNVFHFLRELQESIDGIFKLNVNIEKSVPTFVVGDPTHLRQLLKGILQSCQEMNSINSAEINISYKQNERNLIFTIYTSDGAPVLRDPALQLYLSHYSPFLSLTNKDFDELENDEFIKISIPAPAASNRIEALEIDLSNRQMPSNLVIVSDDLLPVETQNLFERFQNVKCDWLTPVEVLERDVRKDGICLILFINNSQKLKEKYIQKVINYARESNVPSILLSQQPRRGESLTAVRLGFVTYLTLPFDFEELQKLLILTMNKEVRESIGKLGLLTKHTVRDLVPSLGKILLGNISKEVEKEAILLAQSLTALGFKVYESSTVHEFFESLHKGAFEYILCPNGLSTGLRRRIQVSSRGMPCLTFGGRVEGDGARYEESRAQNNSISLQWINIEDVTQLAIIKSALETATLHEAPFHEINSDDGNDSDESSSDKLEVAI